MHRLLLMLALAALFAGCGLKGPLYLPEPKPAAKAPAKPSPATKPESTDPIAKEAKEAAP